MTNVRRLVVTTLLASFLGGCIVHTRRPCRTECFWQNGRKICEKRCN
ncbi:MAG: hypothetical protein NT062_39380 [Proteobacteria bacterium]|nr:hypothetical protein [Pseudomonadota bacterium]